jgi:hypothetical protein
MKFETMTPMSTDDSDGSTWVQKNEDGCINPFCQDQIRMGTAIGRNVTIMFSNFPRQECEYLVIVDTRTGERMRVTFDKVAVPASEKESSKTT